MLRMEKFQSTKDHYQVEPYSANVKHLLPFLSRQVNACNARRTSFNLSFVFSSIKFPWLSNFAGGWNTFKKNSGLLMKWRSIKTPIWRRWSCPRAPPIPAEALMIAAALSAQTFGGLEAQSIAFFKGAGILSSRRE